MTINSTTLTGQLVPAKLSITHSDVVGSEMTDATGTAHRYYLGTKVKLSCTWNIYDDDDVKTLITLTSQPVLTIQYTNPQTGATATIEAYRGDVATQVYSFNNNLPSYNSVSIEFKEY